MVSIDNVSIAVYILEYCLLKICLKQPISQFLTLVSLQGCQSPFPCKMAGETTDPFFPPTFLVNKIKTVKLLMNSFL